MKALNLFLSISYFTSLFFLIACENTDVTENQSGILDSAPIEERSDPECAQCGTLPNACCCKVELQPDQIDMDLHICGVIGSYAHGIEEDCSNMDIDYGCYDVTHKGLHVTLSNGGVSEIYFCIADGSNFSLYNANTNTSYDYIWVGCSSTGSPAHSIGMDLSQSNNGNFVRYFSSSSCHLTPCDY